MPATGSAGAGRKRGIVVALSTTFLYSPQGGYDA